MIIGLCGRSGSGKSTVGKYLKNRGLNYIDTDLVSREVTQKGEKCLSELCEYFGNKILNEDLTLNRRLLASVAMNDPAGYKELNSITHKHIIARTKEKLKGNVDIIDAPLLFESGLDSVCDVTVGVISSDEDCIRRVMIRDSINRDTALSRLARQKDNDFLCTHCDYVITNDSTEKLLEEKAETLYRMIKEKRL